MVTYQKMTFGTKTTAPSIQQVSYQQYQQVAPSYQSYAYTPAQRQDIKYSQQTYQQYKTYNPTPQQIASTPTKSVPTVTTQKAGTPVIQGKNVSYQKVSDLGAIGDTKTIQMPDGSYRNYVRTGTNTYQYTEIRSADKATVMAKSDANGAVQVTKVTPSASAPPSSSVSTVPLVLYEIPNSQHITTSDIPTVGSGRQVNKPDGGFIVYKRVSSAQIQYQEYSKGGQITTPWTSIYDEPPTVAPAAKLTPAVTSPPAATRPASLPLPDLKKGITGDDIPNIGDKKVDHIYSDKDREVERDSSTTIRYRFKDLYTGSYSEWKSLPSNAPGFIAAPKASAKTQIASTSKANKPDLSKLRVQQADEKEESSAEAQGAGDTVSSSDEEATKPAEEAAAEKDEGLVPDWIEEPVTDAFGRAKDPFKRLYNYITEPEVEIPSVERGVVGGGVENPVSPSSEIPVASIAPSVSPSPSPVLPSLGAAPPSPSAALDDGIPRTEEQKQAATLAWLKTKQEYYGLTDKEVENLAKYFSPMLPAMTQNNVDLKIVAANAQLYEDLFNGKAEAFEQFDYILLNNLDTSGNFKGFESLPQDDQKFVLQKWNEKMMDDGVPAIVQASYNAGIYTKMTQNAKTEDVAEWMRKGGVLDAIKADSLWQGLSSANEFLHSKNGMAAVGLTFQAIATIGAFMTAGPVGAAAVAGTTPFSATEAWQTWGDNPFTNKTNLQLDANYAWDYSSQHDQLFNNAKSAVDDMGFKANSNDPAANVGLMSTAERAVDALGKSLKDNYVMLQATGTYDSEVQKYDILKERLGTGKSQFSETGEFDKKQYKPSYADLQNIPAGYHVEWNGETRASGDHKIRGGDGSTESTVIAINDETGARIPLGSVKVQPFGQDTSYDVGSALEKALSYKSGSGNKDVTGKTTVYLPPGVSFTYEGKKYTGGDGGTTFDIKRQSGAPLRLEFTAPGKKPLTEYIGFPESGWNSYAAPANLKGDLAEPENYEGFTVHLLDGQKIYINGLESNKYISGGEYIAVPYGAGKYDVRIVNADGSTAYHNPDEYVSDGKMTALPTTAGEDPKQPYQKQSYSSGGGGGGGGGGSGGSGVSQQQARPEEETLIIYGPTCKDAELWQDEVQVYPEIDVAYSISPGYHSIKAERTGFKTWLKTVYCAKGDSITVSPAFEAVESPGEPTEPVNTEFPKRVFINSDPSGGLVLVNGSSSGEWTPCYLDLPEGYYTFTIKKSGYDPYDIVCYVGEVIAWNQQAIELATSRKWI